MLRLFLIALCLNAIVASGLFAQQEAAAPAPSPIAVADPLPDAAIAARLRAILSALGQEQVEVTVEAGVATLSGDLADAAAAAEVAGIAGRLEGVVALRDELTAAGELAEQLDPAFARFRARIAQVAARLPLLIVAAAVFAAIAALGFLAARLRLWDRLAPNAFIATIYRQIVRILLAFAGFVVALDLAGAGALLGTLLGAAGIVGLAIGFAVRDTVENFVASVMLSLRQPFRPNDLVQIEGESGRVIRLTSRATILLSLDGNHIRIPNATVFKSRIVNFTRNPSRRFVFDIGIDPEADLEATRLLAEETLKGLPFVLAQPEALIWIENITEAGAVLRVTAWIDQEETGFATARGDAIRMVKAAIEAAGVAIPDTTYRIRLEGMGASAAKASASPNPASASPNPARTSPDPARTSPGTAPTSPDSASASPGTAPEAPGEGQGMSAGDAPRPRARAVPASPHAVRLSEERMLIPLVAAEREDNPDLLRSDAPRE